MSRVRINVMTHNMSGKKRLSLLISWVFLGVMVTASVLSAQPPTRTSDLSKLVNVGVVELDQGRLNEALSTFLDGLNKAKDTQDVKREFDFLFYAGLTVQRQAMKMITGEEKKSKLVRASEYYTRMLQITPVSGAALNNLAQVYAGLGDYEESARLFKKAIRTGGTRKGFYALNYANQLKLEGKTSDALRYARLAAEVQPSSLEAHRAVVALYHKVRDNKEFLRYLWRLMKHGAVNRAQEAALDALATEDLFRANRTEFLVLITAALARQYYDPHNFIKIDVGKRLLGLQAQSDLKRPIGEITVLHRGEAIDKIGNWWRSRRRAFLPSALSGREAFRKLANSLAKRYLLSDKQQGTKTAELYYNIAIRFGTHDADPESFLELADLYVNTGQAQKLQGLSARYENSLYKGKADGYRKENWYNIYKFHRALGFMYAHLGQWENPRTYYASAIFQLTHALKTAENYNRYARPNDSPKSIRVPPQIPALLSKAYFETDRFENGVGVAVEYAEGYLTAGHPDQAVETLKYLQEQEVPVAVQRDLKQRYENLVERLPAVKPVPLTVAPPRTIKLDYPYLRGEDVRTLQQALSNRGIDVKPDGIFGKKSQQALKQFQHREGLPVTGETDTATRSRLGLE